MEIRSRAPLRIGLAGGGTDLPSYSDNYGGSVVNVTIGMYAYCTIIPTDNGKIHFIAFDNSNNAEYDSAPRLEINDETLILHKGVYNRIVKDYNNGKPLSFIMSTSNDAPVGSGLGTSSAMVVAILEAFNCWLNLGLDDYQKAKLAFEIERIDLKLAGGKQDQYASVFGGFNFIEFNTDKNTIVNAMRIKQKTICEFECSLLLFHNNGKKHNSSEMQLALSANILESQNINTDKKVPTTLDALEKLKENAYLMKNLILTGNLEGIAQAMRDGWEQKKKTSNIISNIELEKNIEFALANGAEAVKVTGAGGNGFLLLYCKPINRQGLIDAFAKREGRIYPVKICATGAESWTIN